MVRLTLIARITDGLPLAEGLDSEKDNEIDQYKAQAKSLFKRLGQASLSGQAQKMSVDAGKYMFHYVLDSGAVFLTLAERGYPKSLAFQYLQELAGEFGRLYGTQVDAVQKPYAFIKFDTFIQKTKKLYMDTHTQRNMAKLKEDLGEVHDIMTRNIQEVLGQGVQLDNMAKMSSNLADESKKYRKRATDLHRQAIIRKYVPLIVICLVVFVIFWIRNKFYLR